MLLISALILACSSGERRAAEAPEAPSEHEASDGFTPEQREELSELLGEDVTGRPDGEAGARAEPAP